MVEKKVSRSYLKNIANYLQNFYCLFDVGSRLVEGNFRKYIPNPSNTRFVINSPMDLLEANLAIRDCARRCIATGLYVKIGTDESKELEDRTTRQNEDFSDPLDVLADRAEFLMRR
jgi:hypothetical protein